MNNLEILNKPISHKFKILLLILSLVVVVIVYLLLVHFPMNNEYSKLKAEHDDIETKMNSTQIKLSAYNSMKLELSELSEQYGSLDKISQIPEYDNMYNLMLEFNDIFKGLNPNISFLAMEETNGVVLRPISFRVSVSSYNSAKNILQKLSNCKYRNMISDVSISPVNGLKKLGYDEVYLSGVIIFYENGTLTK